MIEVKNLTKNFGSIVAVNQINLQVERGTVLGFLGPNGAGKSTAMKMITGFMRPDKGDISICGFDMAKTPLDAKKHIGYLPEGSPLYGDMTPRKFLKFIADVRHMSKDIFEERFAYVVEKIAISSVLDQRIDTLSKGFKRRIGLAQAVLHDPKVLILDEPTDGLDPNQKRLVRGLIKNIAAEKSIIISTHILEEVDALCTRAVIINRGNIVIDSTPQKLLSLSARAGAVVIEVEGPEEVSRVLEGLPSVNKVEASPTQARTITVYPHARDHDLLPVITGIAQEHKWQIYSMYLEKGRLDDVFYDMTQGEVA